MKYFYPTLLTLALITIASSVRATTVTYSTTGSFNGGAFSSPTSIGFGGGANTTTLTFTGVSATVDTDPFGFTFASLGTMHTASTGSGASVAGTTFAIQITQTVPSAGSGNVSGTISGFISQNSSTSQITFTVTSVTIGAITYSVPNNPLSLVPPVTNNGNTTIQGRVTAVPEPATLGLLGAGLFALAATVSRKIRR